MLDCFKLGNQLISTDELFSVKNDLSAHRMDFVFNDDTVISVFPDEGERWKDAEEFYNAMLQQTVQKLYPQKGGAE